ncbi:putative leader peptide [Actinacidiphila sp. SB3-2]
MPAMPPRKASTAANSANEARELLRCTALLITPLPSVPVRRVLDHYPPRKGRPVEPAAESCPGGKCAARKCGTEEMLHGGNARRVQGCWGLHACTYPRGPDEGVEVRSMRSALRARLPRRSLLLAPRRRVRLYTRPHIDLLRVAGALCRS